MSYFLGQAHGCWLLLSRWCGEVVNACKNPSLPATPISECRTERCLMKGNAGEARSFQEKHLTWETKIDTDCKLTWCKIDAEHKLHISLPALPSKRCLGCALCCSTVLDLCLLTSIRHKSKSKWKQMQNIVECLQIWQRCHLLPLLCLNITGKCLDLSFVREAELGHEKKTLPKLIWYAENKISLIHLNNTLWVPHSSMMLDGV